MSIRAKPIGNIYAVDVETDIAELSYRWELGLRVIVSSGTGKFTPIFLEIVFPDVRGFRFLDEGDLIRYWESNVFNERYHVYEIEDGGWLTGETLDGGMLSVSSS